MVDKVLFLDIDGPMIPNRAWVLQPGKLMTVFDPIACAFIKRLMEKSGGRIVLSSTWRTLHSEEEMYEIFEKHDIPRELFHEDYRTIKWEKVRFSDYRNYRAEEIKEWLSRHPEVTTWAVVDDDEMEIDNFVYASSADGILQKQQDQLFKLLKASMV